MKKVAVSLNEALWEKRLRSNLSTIEDIRIDGLNDLRAMQDDFHHWQTVLISLQENYQALLAQNQRLKSMLLGSIDECYCWPGNRCDRCTKIIELLGDFVR
ncbi:hypothetical protein [Planktothricoides raciborskii]|uniref:Uncharacterized protein n=2 Tax=Planktothricoides raciborskii TaxID=132608 RepID=A0AAU8JIP8_9CYAN|nr:hypothetical protein [Planktothricoides raciborskii]MBD2547407.1 hypothetical protein [Planktothricoides raciborskii FACHB-1370]MBD2584547.1 hypothetical protein [Planktothricoides raciborskii FACHB-1261]